MNTTYRYAPKKGLNGKTILTLSIVAVAAILLIVLAFSCFATVPTGHTGIITTFGKVENQTLEAGMHFKLPWQKVINMDNRNQKSTLTLVCFSSDIQEVDVVYTVNYQIEKKNAQNIYKTIGTDRAAGEAFVARCADFAATNNMNITITVSDDPALASDAIKQYL